MYLVFKYYLNTGNFTVFINVFKYCQLVFVTTLLTGSQGKRSAKNCYQIGSSMDRFLTDDELKYATEEWLKEQSEVFCFISY